MRPCARALDHTPQSSLELDSHGKKQGFHTRMEDKREETNKQKMGLLQQARC